MRLFTSVSSDATQSCIAAIGVNSSSSDFALAISDPQTGELTVKDAVDAGSLARELGMFSVREVVLPRSAFGDAVDRRSAWVRSMEGVVGKNSLRFRAEASHQSSLEGSMTATASSEFHGLSPAAKRAVRLLLSYLDEVSLGNAVPIASLSLARGEGHVAIDAATRRNLELVQNSKDGSSYGSLFGFLQKTVTPLGARQLKSWILAPLLDRSAIVRRQDAVAQLMPSAQLVHAALNGIADLERLAARVQLLVASPKDLGAVRDALEKLPSIQALLLSYSSDLLSELNSKLDVDFELVESLSAALIDNPPHTTNEGGIFKTGFDAELDQILALRSNAESWRASFEAREREATGINSLKVRSNNVIGYFIEVPTAHGAKVPESYQRRQSTANAERFVTPELKQHEHAVVTATDRQIRREQLLFTDLRSRVAPHVEAIRLVAGALASLDALAALAERATQFAWSAPTIVEEPILEIDNGFHPIVAELLEGAFIPNSSAFSSGGPSCFVLTGPNMGGKSTYLRQTGLIVVLAQIGSFVPAASATIGIVDRIFARLGATDDLHEGDSTFMVEMREAAQILGSATSRSLVLIDELGRGTATSDGLSLAQAILERLALEVKARTLFATHYHELTALKGLEGSVDNLSVGSVEEDDRVIFTHRIQSGAAPRSYGLEVAKLSGLPTSVISRAYEVLSMLPSSGAPLDGLAARAQSTTIAAERQFALFSAQRTVEKSLQQLQQRVVGLTPDTLSPREAHAILYELRELALKFAEQK
jgi:DNA mismatch repair protein MutS